MRSSWWIAVLLPLQVAAQSQPDSAVTPAAAPAVKTISVLPPPNAYEYSKPKSWGFVTNVPGDLWQLAKDPFKKENLKGLLIVTAATAALLPFDQALQNSVKGACRHIRLSANTDYTILLKSGETKIFKVPRNLNSALYQMGEGGTSMLVAGGLFVYGKIKKDYRALQTASDITETFITMGIATQLLKRSFGRQSPFMATHPGGDWHPFPSFKDFQTNTSNFDAFPSGHLATMMATVTVLTDNYPEKKWIKPVGYGLIGLTGWAMMNTDVHWISDYPLALAIGYLSGKITYLRHKHEANKKALRPGI